MNPYEENKLLSEKEIASGAVVLKSVFRGLGVALTSRCPLKCIMCSGWEHKWDIPESTVSEISGSFKYLSRLYWQGGEVFLSRYFEPLFDEASRFINIRQEIVTSGLMIDLRWAEKLVSANLNLILSIDGIEKETYE